MGADLVGRHELTAATRVVGDAPINVKPLPRGSGVKTADKTFMSQSLSEGMLL